MVTKGVSGLEQFQTDPPLLGPQLVCIAVLLLPLLLPAPLLLLLFILILLDMHPCLDSVYRLVGYTPTPPQNEVQSGESMKLLKDVLLSQHRTMFYTATLTPGPAIPTPHHAPKNLKVA